MNWPRECRPKPAPRVGHGGGAPARPPPHCPR